MKSNKALRFIVLLIAVMAFFIVYASTGSGSDKDDENASDGQFSGTYVYTFQTTGRCKFVFDEGGTVTASESLDSGSSWTSLGTTTYRLSESRVVIYLASPLDGISKFTETGTLNIVSDTGWTFYKQ